HRRCYGSPLAGHPRSPRGPAFHLVRRGPTRSLQKSGFLTGISVLSICGAAISSCALSSVVTVMGGFSQDLKRKIRGNNAPIVVATASQAPWADYDTPLEVVRKVPGVTGATPVVHGEGMASSASNLAGVIVTGIDPTSINGVIELKHNLEVGKLEYL